MAESRRKGIRLVIILCVVVALAVTGILIWTSRRATVKFYSEHGNLDPLSVSIGGTIEQPKDPVPNDNGYAFGGWYSDPGYTTEYDFDLPIERDTTIYVKWVEKTFTVTVVRTTNTGSFNEVLWTESGKYKSTITLPTKDTSTTYQDKLTPKYNFQRANQTFVGFATRPNASGDFGYQYLPGADFTIPNDSVFLYAIFRGEERSFVFNPNGGDGAEKDETGYFNEYFTVPEPEGLSKQFHSFKYWCSNSDGIPRNKSGLECDLNSGDCVNVFYPGNPIKVNNETPTILYAVWERNQVNIEIDAQGGFPSLGAQNSNKVDAGLEGGYDLSTITQPTRDGYRLLSYNTEASGLGTSYELDAVLTVGEENIKLYAIWAKELTVAYTLNNTKVSDDELYEVSGYEDFTGIEGESFTVLGLPVTIELQNFTFLGWSLNESATAADIKAGDIFTLKESDFEVTDRIYLYGVWQGDSRTLKLTNTADNQVQEISSYYGRREKLTANAIHTDSNYYFVGWGTLNTYNYKSPQTYTGIIYGLGEYFEMGSNSEPGQPNDILYSLWCPYDYTVTYYLQGGELAVAPGESTYKVDYTYKETVVLYQTATRDGYRFMGWSYSANSSECAFKDDGNGTGFRLEMPGNAFQLYAVWSKEYTITFVNNAANATGLVTPITNIILGETFTIPTESVSNTAVLRENYSIRAWATKPEGGTEYAFGETITLEQSDLTTFYAVWKGDARYIRVFDSGSLVTTIEGEYGTDIPLLFETEIENSDPGYEIGGFYALLEQTMTGGNVQVNRQELEYGGNVRTTGMFFQDKDGRDVDTLDVHIVWNKRYFTIVYELNGGTYNNDDSDDMSSLAIYDQYTNVVQLAPLTPTKNRYEFKGWTEDVDDDTAPRYLAGADYTIPARNVTLYASWARIYTLSFSSNGGELISGEEDLVATSYAKGTKIDVPNSPYTKTYYTFSSWNTRADGQGTEYAIGSKLEITADVTLYAIWLGQEVDLFLLARDPGDATYTRDIVVNPRPRYGDTVSLSTWASTLIAPTGLTLKGWKISQPTTLDADVDYTADYVVDQVGQIQLFTVWAPRSYYFIIGLNGGIYNKTYNDYSQTTAYRASVNLSNFTQGAAPITRDGYELMGFADTAAATVPTYGLTATFTMPAETKKIFAVWQELAVITFDKNCDDTSMTNEVFNGIQGDGTRGTVPLETINAKFKRTNYTLVGWSTSSTATRPDAGFDAGVKSYTIKSSSDIYLYAIWEGRAITVRFNDNPDGGGGSSTIDYTLKYGDKLDLTESTYTRTSADVGFSFSGWSKTSGENNGGAFVGNVYEVSTDSEAVSIVELYAIWTKKFFTIIYDYGDSSLGSKPVPDGFDSRSVQYTTQVDVSAYVTEAKKRLGYDFMGWAINAGETNPDDIYGRPSGSTNVNLTFTMPNSNITLHAIWKPIYVTVIFKSNTPTGATETWQGAGTNKFYTVNDEYLYQLSLTLPSNNIKDGVGVFVASYRFVGWIVEGDPSNTIRDAGSNYQINVRDLVTFIAQWEPNIISVVVNANGGIIDSGTTKTYSVRERNNFTFPIAPEISRAGYRLVSYTIKNQVYDLATYTEIQILTSLMTADDVASNTVRATANWIKQITVQYNKNGKYGETIAGTIENSVFDAGKSIVLPNCTQTEGFQRTYYKFIGWNEFKDGSGTTFSAGDTYTASQDTTLYAMWEGNARTVVLHYSTNQTGKADSGTATVTVNGLKYGSMLDTSAYPGTCTSDSAMYKLDGWTTTAYTTGMTTSQFYSLYQHTTKIEIKGTDASPTVNLYAVWKERNFKLIYDANGGVFVSNGETAKAGPEPQGNSNVIVASGETGEFKVQRPDEDRVFYTFVGWSTNSSMAYANAESKYPTTYAAPATDKIYYSSASTNVFGFVMPASDVTLYAVWQPVLVTIKYYLDTEDETPDLVVDDCKYGDTIYLPEAHTEENPTFVKLENHSFGEWIHVESDLTTEIRTFKGGTGFKVYDGNMSESEQLASLLSISFVAKWIPQTVYVQIMGNGGQFRDGEESKMYESAVGRYFELPKVKEDDEDKDQLVYVNYALKSYNLKANGSSPTTFQPGEKIEIPSLKDSRLVQETVEINGELVTTYTYTIYAQWVDAEAFIYVSDDELDNPYYETLAGAIADVNSGGTVKILKDCYIKSEISINKVVTIAPYSTTEVVDLTIFRFTDEDDPTKNYKGTLFKIGADGMLTIGEDAAAAPLYTISIDGATDDSTDYGTMIDNSGILRLYNGVMMKNNRAANGGAITMSNANASAILHYVVFEMNQASSQGGAIYSNLAGNVEVKYCEFSENIAEGRGGAIYNNKTMVISENTFYQNEAEEEGGAVYNTSSGIVTDSKNSYDANEAGTYGGAINNQGGTYNITESTFTSNFARTSGGAVFNAETSNASINMTIKDCTFGQSDDDTKGNSATSSGGAVGNNGKTSIQGTNFYANKVSEAGYGGAVFNDNTTSSLIMSTSKFEGNVATNGYGGAIANRQGTTAIGEEGVDSSAITFKSNSSTTGRGYAIAVVGGVVNVYYAEITEHIFEETTSYGGVIFQNAGVLNLYGGNIYKNTITKGKGAALLVSGGQSNLIGALIYENEAVYGGAVAITSSGNVKMTGGEIYNNTAGAGGAVFIESKNGAFELAGGIIGGLVSANGNKAIGYSDDAQTVIANGGGFYSFGKITVNGGSIRNNDADANGGGIYSNGTVTLVAGSITENIAAYSGGAIYADATGGSTNGTVTFTTSRTVKFLIQNNLCADGAYADAEYDDANGAYYGNGIHTSTQIVISGYMEITSNGKEDAEEIINDIFLAVRDTNQNTPTKIVVFTSDSKELNDEARICITSKLAQMGDKLVKFPSKALATNNLSKFSYAGDESGFRIKDEYLILGNYAAVIMRGTEEKFYQSLTAAYLDAQDGEEVVVYKHINIQNDLEIYNEDSDLANAQKALVGDIDITSSFYIGKKVQIVAGAAYNITRGGIIGDLFTVVGAGQLILGSDSPVAGANLNIKGDSVETGSLIKVEAAAGDNPDVPKLIINDGVTLTGNKALNGGAIYAEAYIQLLGGTITKNTATEAGGGIYATGYVEMTDAPTITDNTANIGGGVYISNSSAGNSMVMNSENAKITKNTASHAGAGIYVNAGTLLISGCTISENVAAKRNSAGLGGGGIYLAMGTTMKTEQLTANNATNAGYIKIIKNETGQDGGGILVDNATLNYTIGTISENDAASAGGGIAIKNSTAEATPLGVLNTSNTAYVNYINTNKASNGGGIAILEGTANISYIKISGNEATRGGGILNKGVVNFGKYTHIGNPDTIAGNKAVQDGGGLYNDTTGIVNQVNGDTGKLQNLIVVYNEATSGNGGGIANNGTMTFVHRTDIHGNSASAGGGIAVLEDGTWITKAYGEIYRNSTHGSNYGGGGLYNIGTTKIEDSGYKFGSTSAITDGNTSVRGGGIYNSGTLIFGSETREINATIYVTYNTADLFGGGIYMNNGTFEDYTLGITDVSQNRQTVNVGGGGGVAIAGGDAVLKVSNRHNAAGSDISGHSNCRFYMNNNSAGGAGGGILISDTGEAGVTLNSVRIASNSSAGRGGGMALQGGIVRFGDPTNGQISYNSLASNTSNIGSAIYLETVLHINCDLTSFWDGASVAWKGEYYFANAKSYLNFSKKSEDKTYGPASNIYINVKANDYTDGRRIAKFGTFVGTMQIPNNDGGFDEFEYEGTFAENYYVNFTKLESGIKAGITYDDNGYVVFADPVAYNANKNAYYSTLADAALKASSGDYIVIEKSHTVTNQVLIVDKTLYFIQKDDIILTRSPKLFGDMFRIFTTSTAREYTVSFNLKVKKSSTAYGSNYQFGDGVTLTLDGNKNHPTLLAQSLTKWGPAGTYDKYSARGSLIGVSGGLYYNNDDGSFKSLYYTNAGHLFGHCTIYANSNVSLYGSEITTTGYQNGNVHPARVHLNVYNSVLRNNFSAYAGGAICYKAYTPLTGSGASRIYLENCDFLNNETGYYSWQGTTRGGSYTYYQSGAGGGAVFIVGGRSYMKYCDFDNNISATHGGAVSALMQQYYTSYSSTYQGYSPFEMSYCNFTNNKAIQGCGGAMEIVAYKQGNISMSYTTFTGNESYTHGGAVYLMRTAKTYQDLIDEGYVHGNGHALLPGNITVEENYTYTYNGATHTCPYPISVQRSVESPEKWTTTTNMPYFDFSTGCSFEGNSAGVEGVSGGGGAIFCRHFLRFDGSDAIKIADNTSTYRGGGIWTASVTYLNNSSLEINNNSAKDYGGGIYYEYVPNYINGVTIKGNKANYGGGIFFNETGSGINSAYIEGNEATTDGGGVYFSRTGWILGGFMDNNSAGRYGGGIAAPYSNSRNITLGIYNVSSVSGNKAAQRGGGIYCYSSLVLVGANSVVANNEVYSVTNDKGGGAGIWSYWEVILSGSLDIMGNKITAPSALSEGGGAGVFIYLDELWITYIFSTTTNMTTMMQDPNTYVKVYDRGVTDDMYANTYHHSNGYYAAYKLPDTTRTSCVQSPNVSISGNDAGLSQGDGLFYWGRTLYMSGTIKIEDDIYMKNAEAAKIVVACGIAIQPTPYRFTYPNQPSDGTTFVQVPKNVPFTKTQQQMFALTDQTYYVEHSSGTFGGAEWYTGPTYRPDVLKLAMKKGSVRVIVTADNSIGESLNGSGMADFTAAWGEAMVSIYKKSMPYREGYLFAGFNIVKTDGTVLKQLSWNSNSSGSQGMFLTKAEATTLYGGATPAEIRMVCRWTASSYTIWIAKYVLDSDYTMGSRSIRSGQYYWSASTSYSYSYTITSRQLIGDIITYVTTTDSDVDSTYKKDFLQGYTSIGYMLSFDRKYYTATDRYPYSFATYFYIVYRTAVYDLTFNADADSELLTENNVIKAKFNQYVSLLSPSLIYRKGYKLVAWQGSNGFKYVVDTQSDTSAGAKWEVLSNDPTYPWEITSTTKMQSTPHATRGGESKMTLKFNSSGYFYFQFKTSFRQNKDYFYVRYYAPGATTYTNNWTYSYNPNYFYGWGYNVALGGKLEFIFKTHDTETAAYDDTVYIQSISLSSTQQAFTFVENVSFTPVWEAEGQDLRVYYNYPDGGTSFKLYNVKTGANILTSLSSSPVANPTGYTLKGYSTTADGSSGLLTTEAVMPGEAQTYYAQWEAEKVVISYYDAAFQTILYQQEVDYGSEAQVWKTEGVAVWLNVGSQALYDPESSYLVTTKDTLYLSFRAYEI